MSLVTIKVKNDQLNKLEVACKITSIKIMHKQSIGTADTVVEMKYRDPKTLIELGVNLATVSGNEFDKPIEINSAKEKGMAIKTKVK